jgi:hypothetical protein
MSTMIVSVQVAGEGKRSRVEKYLRCEVTGGVEDVRKAVTQMFRKPSDYDLGNKRYSDNTHKRRTKVVPVMKFDDASAEPKELVAT